LCAGCSAGEPASPDDASARGDAGAAPMHADAASEDRCVAPAGTSSAPRTIAEVVDRINAMPKPLSLPCLIETLARPLHVYATVSLTSAQPAVDRHSPRVFMFFDGLTMSVVPAGTGSRLLEFGEHRPDARSLKAEIQFPVESELSQAAPFERIIYDDKLTTCGFCHAAEQIADDVPFTRAYVSKALRPRPAERIGLDALQAEAEACDAEQQPERCALLRSLFAGAAPDAAEFPADYALFQ
jgi:hypothetical protein